MRFELSPSLLACAAVCALVPDAGAQPARHPRRLVALSGYAQPRGAVLASGVRGRLPGAPRRRCPWAGPADAAGLDVHRPACIAHTLISPVPALLDCLTVRPEYKDTGWLMCGLGQVNLALMAFNLLLPAYPLDGGRCATLSKP